MIVKYWDNGAWGFIDNVRQAAHKEINTECAADLFDIDVNEGRRIALPDVSYTPEGLKATKIYFKALEEFGGSEKGVVHAENLICEADLLVRDTVTIILLYLENCKEYDTLILVTNQNTYLLNDKGQTIERLV